MARITEKDANNQSLWQLLYELCRKAGMTDAEATDGALQLQHEVTRSIAQMGGDVEAIPEEPED